MLAPITEKLRVMEEFLMGENFPAFMEDTEDILKILEKSKRHSMYALEIYYSLGNILITFINKKNIRPRLASRIQLMELFDPGSFCHLGAGCGLHQAAYGRYPGYMHGNPAEYDDEYYREDQILLPSHLSELSLTVIGQAIGFNPVYLSRIFKQFEGTSIREYIENCRMDMAMRLIQNSRMKIYEVSEKCGYQNTAYFIKNI